MSETPTCPFVIYIFYTAAACREHRSKAFPHAGAFRPMRRGNAARVSALCSAGLNYKHSAFLVNYKARVRWVHPLTRQRCLERRGAWSVSAGGSRAAGLWLAWRVSGVVSRLWGPDGSQLGRQRSVSPAASRGPASARSRADGRVQRAEAGRLSGLWSQNWHMTVFCQPQRAAKPARVPGAVKEALSLRVGVALCPGGGASGQGAR